MFDSEPDPARRIVAGFVDSANWSTAGGATFRLAAAGTQALLVRPIDDPSDPASWLAERDVDGTLVADLQGLGALDDGTVDHRDEAMLLQFRLDRAGIDADLTTLTGDHSTVVGRADDQAMIEAALEATGRA